jgi:hypothetical protein
MWPLSRDKGEDMHYTQVELMSPDGVTSEVLWLPIREKKAKVGEKVTRKFLVHYSKTSISYEDWTISQVCVTLLEKDLPSFAKKATNFHFESSNTTYISI